MGHPQLPRHPSRAHQPGLRRCLRLRQDAAGALHGRVGPPSSAHPPPAAHRLGGADPRPPSWVHHLGDLPGQPGPDRREYPTAVPRGRARGSGGDSPVAGPRRLRPLWAAPACLLPRAERHPRLLLCRGVLVNGRGSHCLRVGGQQIDAAVAAAFLAACTPAGLHAALAAAERLDADHDAALAQGHQLVERARYEATRAERRYRAVDAENRLVARGLERDWEERLQEVAMAEAELGAREHRRPRGLTSEERRLIDRLGNDLEQVWTAPTTSARDRKELLRTLLAEVIVKVDRPASQAQLTLRWRGGALTDLVIPLPRSTYRPLHTDEKTLSLLRRLAVHYPDAMIASILNRQGRRSARGGRFT